MRQRNVQGQSGMFPYDKQDTFHHDSRTIFSGLPTPLPGGRYHSLLVDPEELPTDLEVSAWTDEGVIMGLRHRRFNVQGVQFHPESILTPDGHTLLSNFLADRRAEW